MKLVVPILFLSCSIATAQTFAVSPPYESTDASGAGQLAGLGATFRQQILIAAVRLSKLSGKQLTGITFRRDSGNTDAFVGGTIKLEIQLSTGPSDPATASSSFAANQLTKPQRVFAGLVSIPSSPIVAASYDPWGPKNAFHITFSTSYKYTGGGLCIDLVGTHSVTNGVTFWLVDYEYDPRGGKVVAYGTGCNMKPLGFGAAAYASAPELRIGSTARIIAIGRSRTSALLALGIISYPNGKPLAAMQAPGCFLYVEPIFVLQAGPFHDFPHPGMPAYLNVMLHIPPSRSLMGSRMFLQFANNETMLPRSSWTNPAGMTTTNGLDLTISSVPPSLQMSTVRSHAVAPSQTPPGQGTVDVSKAPVMRFTYK